MLSSILASVFFGYAARAQCCDNFILTPSPGWNTGNPLPTAQANNLAGLYTKAAAGASKTWLPLAKGTCDDVALDQSEASTFSECSDRVLNVTGGIYFAYSNKLVGEGQLNCRIYNATCPFQDPGARTKKFKVFVRDRSEGNYYTREGDGKARTNFWYKAYPTGSPASARWYVAERKSSKEPGKPVMRSEETAAACPTDDETGNNGTSTWQWTFGGTNGGNVGATVECTTVPAASDWTTEGCNTPQKKVRLATLLKSEQQYADFRCAAACEGQLHCTAWQWDLKTNECKLFKDRDDREEKPRLKRGKRYFVSALMPCVVGTD